MTGSVILSLILAAAFFEILYILFRNMLFTRVVYFFYPVAAIISLMNLYSDLSLTGFAGFLSLLLLAVAKFFFKNDDYEKPDYRYLIILAGTILIHI